MHTANGGMLPAAIFPPSLTNIRMVAPEFIIFEKFISHSGVRNKIRQKIMQLTYIIAESKNKALIFVQENA